MKDETILYIGGALGIGYLLYKLGKPVQDTGEGVATAVGGLGGGIASISDTAADTVSDILSPSNVIKAVSDKAVKLIENTPDVGVVSIPTFSTPTSAVGSKSGFVMLADSIKNMINNSSAATSPSFAPKYGVNYNPFINPTSQSFFTPEMAAQGYTEPALSIQNTVKLAKSNPTVKSAISNKIATPTGVIKTSSSTARYTGGIGKSKVTQKKK